MPMSLNTVGRYSLLDALDNESFNKHTIKYAKESFACSHGDTMLKDDKLETPFPTTIKTEADYLTAAKNCRTHDSSNFNASDIQSTMFVGYDSSGQEAIRMAFDNAADDVNGDKITEGTAKMWFNFGYNTAFEYDGDWTHNAETGLLTLTYDNFESPTMNTIKFMKSDKQDQFTSVKTMFTNSGFSSAPVIGIVRSLVLKEVDVDVD